MSDPRDQCKVCKSPYLPDIERMHYEEGKGNTEISRWLKQTFGADIGRESVRNHFARHSKVPAEVKKQYESQKAATKEIAGRIVDEVGIIDQLILDELETHGLVKAWVSELFRKQTLHADADADAADDGDGDIKLPYIPMSLVTMNQGTIAELRQLIKTKYELLDGDLSGKGAATLADAVKKAHEHRVQRLRGAGGGDKK